MERLRRFILESAFTEEFSRAVYTAAGIFEAVNINKMFLIDEAGSPDAFRAVKDRVSKAWSDACMDGVVSSGNLLQKLLNFLYLMEIRQPGFANADLMKKIHDVAIHGSLDQKFLSKVNSDTEPGEALEILDVASESAEQSAKAYPGLSKSDEAVWNRVKVYHAFPDGFKWVYAVDSSGRVAGFIPSKITSKTMHHCGNEPSHKAGDEYWELRDGRGKAYLTIILNSEGEIEESKSWGNQVNKYRLQILPYVKWLLKDKKVTGVGHRYDYGYATHMNFGVKDFIGDDPEFVDYVVEHKSELIGNTESRILFWQGALNEGYVTVDDLKNAYMSGISRSRFISEIAGMDEYAEHAKFPIRDSRADPSNSLFGANSFAVLCAVCSGNPFTKEELIELIRENKLSLEVFANYNIRLLTPEIQEAFVKTNASNFETLVSISNQVADFDLDPSLWRKMIPTDDEIMSANDDARASLLDRCDCLLDMLMNANPPSKMADAASEVFSSSPFIKFVFGVMEIPPARFTKDFYTRRYGQSPIKVYSSFTQSLAKYPDIPLPPGFDRVHGKILANYISSLRSPAGGESDTLDISHHWVRVIDGDNALGHDRNRPLLGQYTDAMIGTMLQLNGRDMGYTETKENLGTLCQMFGYERLDDIISGMSFESNPTMRGAVATTMPKTDMMGGYASETVREYFYRREPDSPKYVWDTELMARDYDKNRFLCIFDLLIHWPHMIETLDWEDIRTYHAMDILVSCFDNNSMDVPKDELARVITFFVNRLREHQKAARVLWHTGHGDHPYRGIYFPHALAHIVVSYGIDDGAIPVFFREMAEWCMDEDNGMKLIGAWVIFNIPFEEWESEYGKHGFTFVKDYVLAAPADTMYENGYITNFICDKILDNPGDGADSLMYRLSGSPMRRKKSCISMAISKRIIDDSFPMTDSLFNRLYNNRMINAEAYRSVMGRREDRGAVDVKDSAAVDSVIRAFGSIQKMDTLPALIAATVKYIVDLLYANVGDGRYRWKVDENCSREASMLGVLAGKLAAKSTTGNVPAAIKQLYDDGLVDRLREFPAANRAACDEPNRPKSKIKCGVNGDIEDALDTLDQVKEAAFAAAGRPARSAKRRTSARKPVGA